MKKYKKCIPGYLFKFPGLVPFKELLLGSTPMGSARKPRTKNASQILVNILFDFVFFCSGEVGIV